MRVHLLRRLSVHSVLKHVNCVPQSMSRSIPVPRAARVCIFTCAHTRRKITDNWALTCSLVDFFIRYCRQQGLRHSYSSSVWCISFTASQHTLPNLLLQISIHRRSHVHFFAPVIRLRCISTAWYAHNIQNHHRPYCWLTLCQPATSVCLRLELEAYDRLM